MLRVASARYQQIAGVKSLAPKVKAFIEESAKLCAPKSIHICDGTEKENNMFIKVMTETGVAKKLANMDNCYIVRTDPRDVARVESKTVISTPRKEDTVPTPRPGVTGELGMWISPEELQRGKIERFTKCMTGHTMYVIPYSMGPVGGPLSKIGIELTDSAYVAAHMRIMTRMGTNVLDALGKGDFVRGLHSTGRPLPLTGPPLVSNWPCNPEKTIIAHIPATNDIVSFGSGYGGNALLGKKCYSLRLGMNIARREGWMAEHMLILGITNPKGVKRYIAAAFPSACGKTNLAMLRPTIPGYKVECVGDDIAWMRFDKKTGELRAINPENGFFGVAPGTSIDTNPHAIDVAKSNTIYTNVAETSNGGVWWEGMTDKPPTDVQITDWHGKPWDPKTAKTPAAHPNARFCSPARQCAIIDPKWEDPAGVPISAMLFGGRRPQGVPLVYEAFDWKHGVFIGACMKSEVTAAAQDIKKEIRHDPFAMKPFFGYNFGKYVEHWYSMEKPGRKMPKIYHVNWFRKAPKGGFLWPGYGENSRVIDWILRRLDGEDSVIKTAIGNIPKPGAILSDGLKEKVDFDELFRLDREFWTKEADAIEKYMKDQAPNDLPPQFWEQMTGLKERIAKCDCMM